METKIDIGERLHALVNALTRGNQAEFARRCDLQPASLSRLITGKYEMSNYYAGKIRRAFPMVNEDYLFGRSDYPGELRHEETEIERLRRENEVLRWMIETVMRQSLEGKL